STTSGIGGPRGAPTPDPPAPTGVPRSTMSLPQTTPGRSGVPDVSPDLPGPAWRALLALLGRLPQASLSRGLGRIADVPLPERIRPAVLRTFARAFGIDVSEAELPLEAYPSVNAFFVRRLRPGARSWPGDDG